MLDSRLFPYIEIPVLQTRLKATKRIPEVITGHKHRIQTLAGWFQMDKLLI